jgi:hypothetical protein
VTASGSTPPRVIDRRLASQQVSSTTVRTGSELVRWFGAVQGQEYEQTKWSLGLRLRTVDEAAIERELAEGRIVRTHVLRPTWHLVAAGDLRWLLSLTGPRVHAKNAHMYDRLELDGPLAARCGDVIASALEGGRHLPRVRIGEELGRRGIEASGMRLGYIMMRAELDGLVCSGRMLGKQQTYALVDDRVPAPSAAGAAIDAHPTAPSAGSASGGRLSTPTTREEALAELARRYFTSRGPATVHDMSAWSGLTTADCRRGVALCGDGITEERIDGETYHVAAGSHEPPEVGTDAGGETHLIPLYDELVMGYRPKGRQPLAQRWNRLDPKPAAEYDSTVLDAGQIVGTWRRRIRPKAIELDWQLFEPLDAAGAERFRRAIERFGTYNGKPVAYPEIP